MKQWRFEVFNKPGFADVHGSQVLDDIRELGIRSIEAVQSAKVFLVEADFEKPFAQRIASELMADPVCEEVYIGRSAAPTGLNGPRSPMRRPSQTDSSRPATA